MKADFLGTGVRRRVAPLQKPREWVSEGIDKVEELVVMADRDERVEDVLAKVVIEGRDAEEDAGRRVEVGIGAEMEERDAREGADCWSLVVVPISTTWGRSEIEGRESRVGGGCGLVELVRLLCEKTELSRPDLKLESRSVVGCGGGGDCCCCDCVAK